MRRLSLILLPMIAITSVAAHAQAPQPAAGAADKGTKNANPCRDEVATALRKLRNSSWFRMNTNMLTEKGPTAMQIDYVLPDKMHQVVTVQLTKTITEIKMVGDKAWTKDQDGNWQRLGNEITQDLRTQMQEAVVDQQDDVGNYVCKGRTSVDGRDVLSYKLEDEGPGKDSTSPKNEAFRMFYVDALTGLPVSNALVVPGREDKPLFKAVYSYPLDMKIEAPN